MLVTAFVKGFRANPFSESLIRQKVESLEEIRTRVGSHIEAKEVMKQNNSVEKHTRPLNTRITTDIRQTDEISKDTKAKPSGAIYLSRCTNNQESREKRSRNNALA